MTDERTEGDGFAGLLRLTVGGKPVELRVLTIEESDVWQRKLGAAIGGLDIPENADDGGVVIGNMFVAGAAAKLDMVMAYDVDSRLGPREAVRKRMTKSELSAAFETILDVENPKEEAGNRSVVEAFGRQNQMIQIGLDAVQRVVQSQLASSMNGRLPSGLSLPDLSAVGSPTNSSSSSGPTDKSASNGRRKKAQSPPKSPQPTATPT